MKFIFGEGFQRTLGGSMMVAGTAIGAGMLALPMTSAGMWFNWSMVLMLLSWFCMLRASQAILEVNLLFEPGDSLHTLVQNTLGSFWSVLNGFSVAFVLYTLVYAYVSSGGSVTIVVTGDVSGDGKITITDVVQAAQVTVGQRTIN